MYCKEYFNRWPCVLPQSWAPSEKQTADAVGANAAVIAPSPEDEQERRDQMLLGFREKKRKVSPTSHSIMSQR